MNPTPPPEARRPARVDPPSSPELAHLLALVVGVVVVASLYLAREVLIPITLAVLLSFVLAPVVRLLRGWSLPHVAAVLLSVLLALGIITTIGSVIGLQVAGLAQEAPRYQRAVMQKWEAAQGGVLSPLNDLIHRLGSAGSPIRTAQPGAGGSAPVPTAPPALPPAGAAPGSDQRPVPVEIRETESTAVETLRRLISPVIAPLETTLIVFIVAVFFLMQQADLRDRLIRLFGSNDLHRTTEALDDAARRLSRYFLAQLLLNTIFGCIIAIGLFFVGVPSPVVWGILAALLRFIPYIGAPLAAVAPLILAAGTDPGWTMVIWTAALFFITEPIMGQVVEPMVYGHSTGLSPVSVVVAAIFWTWLWGPIGLILATPLTLCLVVLGRHVERLEFLDVMLGDRPALTPVENFYQRILAGDTDEALSQAETLLKERALSAYYDQVALKGLQLAANDVERGVLRDEKLDRVKNAVRGLVADLSEVPDREPPGEDEAAPDAKSVAEKAVPHQTPPEHQAPPPAEREGLWTSEVPVLCLAGRGPLDEATSDMLAQLLGKHGLGARVVPHEASSRDQIAQLDPTGVAMVCVSYLDISGSPAHLRYLLRRLRSRIPGVTLLVGLWPEGEAVLSDAATARAVGADLYVSSLKEAVIACVKAATGGEAEGAARARPALAPAEPAPG